MKILDMKGHSLWIMCTSGIYQLSIKWYYWLTWQPSVGQYIGWYSIEMSTNCQSPCDSCRQTVGWDLVGISFNTQPTPWPSHCDQQLTAFWLSFMVHRWTVGVICTLIKHGNQCFGIGHRYKILRSQLATERKRLILCLVIRWSSFSQWTDCWLTCRPMELTKSWCTDASSTLDPFLLHMCIFLHALISTNTLANLDNCNT